MNKLHKSNAAWALVFALVAVLGCSSPSIVGEWQGDDRGTTIVFTFLSDGTGDVTATGQKTKPITWKRVKDNFEVTVTGKTTVAGLRENGTLAFQSPGDEDLGLLILKRKKD